MLRMMMMLTYVANIYTRSLCFCDNCISYRIAKWFTSTVSSRLKRLLDPELYGHLNMGGCLILFIIDKYNGSSEAASSINVIEGFARDVSTVDLRETANTGFVARADMIRAGTAGAAGSYPFRKICKLNFPCFQGMRQLIYIPKKKI